VSYGLARVNRDNRKIPLGWLVFRECAQVGHQPPEMWPTLSMSAAMMVDSNIIGEHDLAQLQRDVTHPYTKLMPEGTFEYVSAIRLVCNEAGVNLDWTRCADTEGDAKALAALAHKVVIVGGTWNDLQNTDVGKMTGPNIASQLHRFAAGRKHIATGSTIIGLCRECLLADRDLLDFLRMET